jgi:hypothetical protein
MWTLQLDQSKAIFYNDYLHPLKRLAAWTLTLKLISVNIAISTLQV